MILNKNDSVDNQYNTTDKLNIRISLHEKYSTNKIGFNNWIVENYDIKPGMRVLELGCGTGIAWRGHTHILEECDCVYFTDLSEAMLDEAKENIGNKSNFYFEIADVQELPYDDSSFDVIIANMMLFHASDLDKALSEIQRVLSDNGTLYAATFGEKGISQHINNMLGIDENQKYPFTLQNGKQNLNKYFSEVERIDYKDQLEITDENDLIKYILSMEEMMGWDKYSEEELHEILSEYKNDGVITIPKEYGMFISKK